MTAEPQSPSNERIVCAACRHDIDAVAKICPYCGADPRTGTKPVDTQALLDKVFHHRETSASGSVIEFARQRQGVVIALGIIIGLLLLAGLHEYVTRRNARLVSAAAAIPLTEVADLSDRQDENRPLPLPKLDYQFDGNPQMARAFVVEPGAVTPPEVVAAQQAAAQQAAAKQALAAPAAVSPPAAKPPAQPVRPPAH
jgi:hypothetical protein